MEKTTEITVKVTAPPCGHEAFINISNKAVDCTYAFLGGKWLDARFCAAPILARRRETLADWANKQRLFKALAEMRGDIKFPTALTHDGGPNWHGIGCSWSIGTPPNGLTGKLRLEAGKWVDAT